MIKKYIIANVRMPLEILEDGTVLNLKERVQIELEYCKELPPIQNNLSDIMDINYIKRFIEQIEQIEQSDTVINLNSNDLPIWIYPNEIKLPTIKKCNTTLKYTVC